jgi:hypothetical protein
MPKLQIEIRHPPKIPILEGQSQGLKTFYKDV